MKIKCKECNGEGAYEYACWEQSKIENCECSYCDGQGYTEEDIEEYKSVTNVDNLCDRVKAQKEQDMFEDELTNRLAEMAEQVLTITFTGDPSRNYHVTYFISRGEVTEEETPLLGGLTLSADSITHAVTQFMNTTGVDEKEIKYIVEL
jgi:organic radical activating enzyme